jgi:aminopeptidase
MSYDDFFEFFISVCLVDYEKMSRDLVPLRELMEKTDSVHILGSGSDLSFSIKGMNVVPCSGEANIPDGEIYTAPVRESINGVLQYNTTTIYQGKQYVNPRFVFKNGKITEASCENDVKGINDVLDTDEGARYIGEFALGVNNQIKSAFGNTLYDEKIGGSFHMTPGNAYENAFNGNKSAIHWDIVCIQTPEFGGGEIWFDGALVRKDGSFITGELRGLNP